MIDHVKVRQALRTQLVTVAGVNGTVPGGNVAWENRPFTPPQPTGGSVLWLRETYLRGRETKVCPGQTEAIGIYQIDVFCGSGFGTEFAEALATLIGNAFVSGTGIIVGPTQVTVDHCECLSGRTDEDWFSVPVSIQWRTYGATNI